MLVLGIETSCDETAAAVLQVDAINRCSIKSEIVASQIDLHAAYGGVVPELAAREHLKNLSITVDQAINSAGIKQNELEGVAVTRGPGLKGCLLIGLEFAKGFALANSLPLSGVNHIEGHLVAPFLEQHGAQLRFPHLALIVSGGHTELHIVEKFSKYTCLQRTIDDAAGESFDKSAHLLNFPYPGGAALARLADTIAETPHKLPLVMRSSDGFSFSGLKTAISLLIKRTQISSQEQRAQICLAVQRAIVEALVIKVEAAIKQCKVQQLVVSGGVAANAALRKRLAELKVEIFAPSLAHCSDNASMIALAGGVRLIASDYMQMGQSVMARWPVEQVRQI